MNNLGALPPGAEHQITCKFTSLGRVGFEPVQFKLLAELPVNELKFSKVLNGVGPWSGYLNVEDLGMRKAPWLKATKANKTAMWVDIDGALVYGGTTPARDYTNSTGRADLSGEDFCAYVAKRVGEFDYELLGGYVDPEGHNWSKKTPALSVAYWVVKHVLEEAGSINLGVVKVSSGGVAPEGDWISIQLRITQLQTVSSIISQMEEYGIGVGIDYACDVAYNDENEFTATITLSYPTRNEEVPVKTIDLNSVLGFKYSEDGSEQCNEVLQAGADQLSRVVKKYQASLEEDGYPLLQAVDSHPALENTESEGTTANLVKYAKGYLEAHGNVAVTPVLKLPMFGQPSITEIDVGDRVRLTCIPNAGDLPLTNPRFDDQEALEELEESPWRINRIDGEVPDEGEPVMSVTFDRLAVISEVED
jgi:hypothetical protein